MQWHIAVRIVGVVALIAFAILTSFYGIGDREMLLLVIAVVAVVAPEALSDLPFGPNKDEP